MVRPTTSKLLIAAAIAAIFAACSEDSEAPPADVSAGETSDATASADGSANTGDVAPSSDVKADVPSGPWVQEVADEEWQWLSRHDGTIAGAHQYQGVPDAYYEYTRFEVFQPFELRAIRVMPRLETDENFVLYVWDDLGGNFLHMEPTAPLAVMERELTVADSDTWQEFTLESPIRLDPGRIFYVGTIVNGQQGARIAVDAALSPGSEDKPAWSLVWLSKDVEPSTGTNTVFSAGAGDLLVDVEVRHVDVVQGDDFVFKAMPA